MLARCVARYGFDFVHAPQVVDKTTIFVPFGWDSLEKIQLDFDTQRACTDPSIAFHDVIKKPSAYDRVCRSLECCAPTNTLMLTNTIPIVVCSCRCLVLTFQGVQIDMEQVEDFQEFLARHKHTIEKRDFAKAATTQPSTASAHDHAQSPRASAPADHSQVVPSTPTDASGLFLDIGLGSASAASPNAPIPNSEAVCLFINQPIASSTCYSCDTDHTTLSLQSL
jgi:hypothetical protein